MYWDTIESTLKKQVTKNHLEVNNNTFSTLETDTTEANTTVQGRGSDFCF